MPYPPGSLSSDSPLFLFVPAHLPKLLLLTGLLLLKTLGASATRCGCSTGTSPAILSQFFLLLTEGGVGEKSMSVLDTLGPAGSPQRCCVPRVGSHVSVATEESAAAVFVRAVPTDVDGVILPASCDAEEGLGGLDGPRGEIPAGGTAGSFSCSCLNSCSISPLVPSILVLKTFKEASQAPVGHIKLQKTGIFYASMVDCYVVPEKCGGVEPAGIRPQVIASGTCRVGAFNSCPFGSQEMRQRLLSRR